MTRSIRNISCLFISLMMFLLPSCAQIQEPPPTATPLPPTNTPLPAVAAIVQQEAAELLGIPLEEIRFTSIEPGNWEDTCMGLPLKQDTCLQESVSGYQGVLQAEEESLTFRVDAQGRYVQLVPSAVETARNRLAEEFGLDLLAIRIVEFERQIWPDACLGLGSSEQTCAQVNTPGYRITLAENGHTYVYHSDVRGEQIVLAEAPIQEAYIEWEGQQAEQCQRVHFTATNVEWGTCTQEERQQTGLSEAQAADFREFTQLFKPFQTNTPVGEIDFFGSGAVTATPFQQRMIVEWVQWVFHSASTEQPDLEARLIFAWQFSNSRGECYRIEVYTFGEARLSACSGTEAEFIGRLRLISSQLQTLYTFQNQLHSFEHEVTSLGAQETSTKRLVFNGQGEEAATDIHKSWMADLAENIRQQITIQADPLEIEAARQALMAYFNALAQARYDIAAELFGGDMTILRQNNPDIPKDDRPALFQAGCTFNGFVCNLLPLNEVYARQISPERFLFVYELQTPAGELFSLGPCCGADIELEPPQTQFEFIVVKINEVYFVESLPVYVP